MKRNIVFNLSLWIFITTAFLLANCSSSNGLIDRITFEEDIVHSTKRITFKHTHYFYFSKTPMIKMDQTFVKSIHENKKNTINVYDRLTLKAGYFQLQDEVYMIVKNKVYPITPKLFEHERFTHTSSSKKNITTSDDESIAVVTGYNEKERDIVRINYQLTEQMTAAIVTADTVSFRYYAGPHMITVDVKEDVLDAVKELIQSE